MTDGSHGRIFDIQRYSVNDGPGIRTIVFLKGCPMRCAWCSNPESMHYARETLALPDGSSKTVGQDVSVEEVMKEVLKDRPYYRRSGGGLTLSGGDAFFQAQFAGSLLRAAKENDLNTVVESEGFARWQLIEDHILPWLDLMYMDVKHMDPEVHERFTGQSNALILDNARRICDAGIPLVVRVPVIPTFNASEEAIGQIADFAASLRGVTDLHLLPYHPYGSGKWEQLGREYTMSDVRTPPPEEMQRYQEVVEERGLTVTIGGK